jgi:hypothetical protein
VRVKWLLIELLGPAGFEEERVSLYDGEQYLPEFLQKNPNHAVPILQVTDAAGRSRHMTDLVDGERDAATSRRYRSKFTNEAEPQLLIRLQRMPFRLTR